MEKLGACESLEDTSRGLEAERTPARRDAGMGWAWGLSGQQAACVVPRANGDARCSVCESTESCEL